MARYYAGITKRNAATTAQRIQDQAKDAKPAAAAEEDHGGMVHIGADTSETRRAIMPALAASSAEWQAVADTPDDSEAANRALNFDAFVREIEARPNRIEEREKLIAKRNALAAATGTPYAPADRAQERTFQLARFMDAFAEAEVSWNDVARQVRLRAIEADAERILTAEFQYDVRRIQSRVLERFKA